MKKKLPKKIQALGRFIDLVEQEEVVYKDMIVEGLYDHYNKRILIDKNLKEDDKFLTICHEMAHAYLVLLGVSQTLNERELEAVCNIMAMFVEDVLRSFK